MRLKTIREQLLFAADYHHQEGKKKLALSNEMHSINKTLFRELRRQFAVHDKMSRALDEALKLL